MTSSPQQPEPQTSGEGDADHGVPFNRVRWPRRTARLTLRPAVAEDAEAVWRFRRMESVAQWLTWWPTTFDEFRARFEQADWLEKTLIVEVNGEVIGDLGVRRVVADCFAANESSWRLMERVGMRRQSYTVRDSLHRSGEWLDGMTYALLAEEW